MAQSIPCDCDHLLIYCAPPLSSNHSRFIRHSFLFWLQQRHLVAKWGETGWEMTAPFHQSVTYLSYLKEFLTWRIILWHGADGFAFPPKEVVLRYLLPLKINSSRPSSNPRTLGPVASTITITSPRSIVTAPNRQCDSTAYFNTKVYMTVIKVVVHVTSTDLRYNIHISWGNLISYKVALNILTYT
jgi:hypothetical protein